MSQRTLLPIANIRLPANEKGGRYWVAPNAELCLGLFHRLAGEFQDGSAGQDGDQPVEHER